MLGDLSVIGNAQTTLPCHVAAAATRFYAGEPLIQASFSFSSGAASANVYTVAAIDILVIGTDVLGGIAIEEAEPKNSTGALTAQTVNTAVPLPMAGRIRGVGETKASIDTDAEILAITNDVVLIDYNSTGSPSSGPLYTIKVAASADTSGFQVKAGNATKGTLDVVVDADCYRFDRT